MYQKHSMRTHCSSVRSIVSVRLHAETWNRGVWEKSSMLCRRNDFDDLEI
jgi:hypothetical protein